MKDELTNLTYLQEASANNNKFIKEMISLFLRQTPEFLTMIKKSLDQEDRAEAAKVLHKLKPCMKMMGMDTLETHIKKMENDVKSGNEISKTQSDLIHLESICVKAYTELEMKLLKLT